MSKEIRFANGKVLGQGDRFGRSRQFASKTLKVRESIAATRFFDSFLQHFSEKIPFAVVELKPEPLDDDVSKAINHSSIERIDYGVTSLD